MTYTPEQAYEIWCPMVRHSTEQHPTFNRGTGIENPLNEVASERLRCHCIADQCAMFRWVPVKESMRAGAAVNYANQEQARAFLATPTHGYCGLAGRPVV